MHEQERKIREISRAILKRVAGQPLSPRESEALDAWARESDENRQALERAMDPAALKEVYGPFRQITPAGDWIARLPAATGGRPFWRHARRVAAAAAVIALLACPAYFLSRTTGTTSPLPAGEVVSLVIGHGVDSLVIGVDEETELNIPGISRDTRLLTYDSLPPEDRGVEYHVLRVGRGGEFTLQLADGTRVWINSESSLRYPTRFDGAAREVELTGEGYFEVARSGGKPFVVRCGTIRAEVLGTSFNVASYPGEEFAHVTLATGKLLVREGEREVVLRPGQQARINEREFSIREVDARLYTGWTRNLFTFDEEPLELIGNKLTRWYGYTFIFEDDVLKNTCFSGVLSRYATIAEALDVLEMTTNVQFSIHAGEVTVMRKR
jgi:ferric-dicitrate binding protein FerR (iron transport regulator)